MPEMAWFALYVSYTLLFFLLTVFDLFYRTILLIFPYLYSITGKALLNGRVCENSPKRVTEVSEKEGKKCETYLTLKKRNVDYRYKKIFNSKEHQQCGTKQVEKACYISGTKGRETYTGLGKGWFAYDIIIWRWNSRSDRLSELGWEKALPEV